MDQNEIKNRIWDSDIEICDLKNLICPNLYIRKPIQVALMRDLTKDNHEI